MADRAEIMSKQEARKGESRIGRELDKEGRKAGRKRNRGLEMADRVEIMSKQA